MITIGMKFLFKGNSTTNNIGEFSIDEIYTLQKIDDVYGENYYYLEDNTGGLRYFTLNKHDYYIYDYFCTVAELRDRQIDMILDGED